MAEQKWPTAPRSPSHDRPDDNVIVFNLLVENDVQYRMTRRTPVALGATNTTFAFNVIQGGGAAARIDGPNAGAVWQGNVVWQTAEPGDLPATGRMTSDPGLVRDAHGLSRLPAESATTRAAVTAYPFIGDVDFALARPMSPAEVGPES